MSNQRTYTITEWLFLLLIYIVYCLIIVQLKVTYLW